MPVPAGSSLPMMTFSLRPISESLLPSMAASVSTLVVSWKEAADSHDSVASDALVIPISTARPEAGVPPSATTLRFWPSYITRKQLGVTRFDHRDPAQHLPDDDLDVLVVDRRTLGPVDRLHLVHQVLLHPTDAEHPQHVVRVGRSGGQLLTHLDVVPVLD